MYLWICILTLNLLKKLFWLAIFIICCSTCAGIVLWALIKQKLKNGSGLEMMKRMNRDLFVSLYYPIFKALLDNDLDYSFIDERNIALFIVEDECLFIDFKNNIMIEWYKFMHFGRCAMTNATTYVVSLLDKQFYEELIEDTVKRIDEYGKNL